MNDRGTTTDGNLTREHDRLPERTTLETVTSSEAETDALGQRFAAALEPNLVVALHGDLGAGKTRFVRAVAVALGADPNLVNSPTFMLIQQYEAQRPLIHCDAYRLRDADEFADLGAEELFTAGGVCFIEWAERVADLLPDDRLDIEIVATGPTQRSFRLSASGDRSRAVLARIA